jgi:hypothetical protein
MERSNMKKLATLAAIHGLGLALSARHFGWDEEGDDA